MQFVKYYIMAIIIIHYYARVSQTYKQIKTKKTKEQNLVINKVRLDFSAPALTLLPNQIRKRIIIKRCVMNS